MAERGARPHVHPVRKWLLHAVRRLFTPLEPDHYLEMINPLWSTRELRGRVERVGPESEDTASVLIRPAYEWPGHEPGQYVRLGVIIDGVYHWRAYSLTSDPDPRDGLISVTPKVVEGGVVSPYLVRKIAPGEIVRLGEVEGVFTLPDPVPAQLLFISAGSGITPVSSPLSGGMREAARAAPSTSSTANRTSSATGEPRSWSRARTPASSCRTAAVSVSATPAWARCVPGNSGTCEPTR